MLSVRAARTRWPSSITAGAKANVLANVADAIAPTRSVSRSMSHRISTVFASPLNKGGATQEHEGAHGISRDGKPRHLKTLERDLNPRLEIARSGNSRISRVARLKAEEESPATLQILPGSSFAASRAPAPAGRGLRSARKNATIQESRQVSDFVKSDRRFGDGSVAEMFGHISSASMKLCCVGTHDTATLELSLFFISRFCRHLGRKKLPSHSDTCSCPYRGMGHAVLLGLVAYLILNGIGEELLRAP